MKRKMPSKTVLVVGSTGYIGKALVLLLLEKGFNLICPVRSVIKAKKIFNNYPNLSLLDYKELDFYLSKQPIPPIGLISCIASRYGGIKDSWEVDYQMNKDMLRLASKNNIKKFILLSAICLQKPSLEFHRAKLAFELELKSSNISFDIIRPTAFFKSLSGQIERVRRGKSFLIFGNGQLTKCKPISKQDLSKFIYSVMKRKNAKNGIHIVGGPGPCITPKEQGILLFKLLKKKEKFSSINPRIFMLIASILFPFSKISDRVKDYREFFKIANYYATESMLFWDKNKKEYNSRLTPEFGSDCLESFYRKLILSASEYDELKDQKLF